MSNVLRPYQANAVDFVRAQLRAGIKRLLIAAPTGTGKSYIINALVDQLPGRVGVISPRIEILRGIAEKRGITKTKRKELEAEHLWTPICLRNRIFAGLDLVDTLIIDEGHHATAETYQILDAMHGDTPVIGLTATPYRSTPNETAKLCEYWGAPHVALSLPDAIIHRWSALPRVEIRGLCDDDQVKIQGADFRVSGAGGLNEFTGARIEAIAELAAEIWERDPRPMMISLPSTFLVDELMAHLQIPACAITQRTKSADRERAFADVVARRAALVQINVVSEGVDLPIRVMIDAKPTLSPVAWMQQIGRITRPTDDPPLYVCTNRNIERHAHLLEGLLPSSTIYEAQQAFERPPARTGLRHFGLEALGRYKAVNVPLDGGIMATAYTLYDYDNASGQRREFFALVLPGSTATIFATRLNDLSGTEPKWGRWRRADLPDSLTGYGITRSKMPCSDKQFAWWERDARRVGLDPSIRPSKRVFAVLPVLMQLRLKVLTPRAEVVS